MSIALRNPNTGEVIVVNDEIAVPYFPDHSEKVSPAEAKKILNPPESKGKS